MLDLDYSGCNDFWDYENKRELSIEEAVDEGYFNTVKDAKDYKEMLEFDWDEDE